MERILFATGIAAEIYGRTGADMADPPGVGWLAWRLFGDEAVRETYAGERLPGDAVLSLEECRWRIVVRGGLLVADRAFAIAHELGEHAIRGYRAVPGGDREATANMIAACLIAPWPAFVSATLALGEDLPALARAFVTTQSMVALRWGETRGEPVALLTPQLMRTRGDERLWSSPDGRRMPGIRSVRLTDDVRRTAMFSAA